MSPPHAAGAFDRWIERLEQRHLRDLTFSEASSALRVLSSTYVAHRGALQHGRALQGAGKRAAFALFYGPLHFLLVRAIVESLPGALSGPPTLVDLGCGTGAAGAAWAVAQPRQPRVIAIDRNPWALDEAGRTYREFELTARTIRENVPDAALPRQPAAFLAAFFLNELGDDGRDRLLRRLLDRGERGDRVLIVEPIAGFVARWWDRWRADVEARGGRADEWRFKIELPPIVAKLDRAAKMDHRELTGRSFWIRSDSTLSQPSREAGRAASS